jgi:methyl-accepting chemotaxis protein
LLKFKDWKIGVKLAAGFGLVLLCMSGLGSLAVAQAHEMDSDTDRIVSDAIPDNNLARDLLLQLVNEETGVRALLATGDEKYMTAYNSGLDAMGKDLTSIQAYYPAHPEIKELVEQEAKPEIQSVDDTFKSLIDQVRAGQLDQARARIGEAKSQFKQFRETNKKILDLTDQAIAKSRASSQRAYHKTQSLIIGFLAVALAIASLIAFAVTRSIVAPLRRLSDRFESLRAEDLASLQASMNSLAVGDLTVRPNFTTEPMRLASQDEVGNMSRTFDEMLAMLRTSGQSYDAARVALNTMIGNIRVGGEVIANTSESLAATSEQSRTAAREIAKGSESLATSATDTASVMEEFSAQVGLIKEASDLQVSNLGESAHALEDAEQGIGGVANAAERMAASALEGHGAVKETIAVMNRVQNKVDHSATKVRELDEKGRQIGKIVLSIQSIAEQTNLLALNAAIEAARAGEHGKGFAVVAEEVRKLAEQAERSTREIGELINQVTSTVDDTVAAIESTTIEVKEGSERSHRAGESLEQILSCAEEVAARSQEVAALTNHAAASMVGVKGSARENSEATVELEAGAERVGRSVTHVASISEESAASAEELSASIDEVSRAAEQLNTMSADFLAQVSRFKLETDASAVKLKLAA